MVRTVGPWTLQDLQLCFCLACTVFFLSNLDFKSITYFQKNAQIVYVQLDKLLQILNAAM